MDIKLAPKTYASYKNEIEKYIKPRIGAIPLQEEFFPVFSVPLRNPEYRAKERGFGKMIGTEKQVAWAEKIRAEVLEKLQDEISWYEGLVSRAKDAEKREKAEALLGEAQKALAKVEAIEDARWFIDHRTGSTKKIVQEILEGR